MMLVVVAVCAVVAACAYALVVSGSRHRRDNNSCAFCARKFEPGDARYALDCDDEIFIECRACHTGQGA